MANAFSTTTQTTKRCPKFVKIAGRVLKVDSSKLDMFFTWMAERDRIRRKRASGLPPPWTDDPILREQKFCNVFRIHDRGTQYVLKEVINKGDQSFHEMCFRIILFKFFNRISTWETLDEKLGPLLWSTFNIHEYGDVLQEAHETCPLYTGAYQIPRPNMGYTESYMNHLALLEMMMEDDVPRKLLRLRNMRDGFELISQYPGMGPFLSYQLILDLNNTPHLNFSENEWASYGPGSKKCLRLIFGNIGGIESEAMRYLYLTQKQHFNRLGITDPPVISEASIPGVSLVDIEHALCEVAKYDRGSFSRSVWQCSKAPITSNFLPKKNTRELSTDLLHLLATPATLPQEDDSQVSVIELSDEEVNAPVPDALITRSSSSPVSKLPSTRNEFQRETTPLWAEGYEDDNTEYEVSHIYRERLGPNGWEFKVAWVGWSRKHDTWLPEWAFGNASSVLKTWRKLHPISMPGKKQTRRKRKVALANGNNWRKHVVIAHRRQRKPPRASHSTHSITPTANSSVTSPPLFDLCNIT